MALSLDARYQSAWREANTRITQRQNAFYIFLFISVGVIAFGAQRDFASCAQRELLVESSEGQLSAFMAVFIRSALVICVPLGAIGLGWPNEKHDETISLLRYFMKECEKVGNNNQDDLRRLSYNWNPEFVTHANSFRNLHDKAFGLSIAVTCLLAFIMMSLSSWEIMSSIPSGGVFGAAYAVVYWAAVAYAIVLVYARPKFDGAASLERTIPLPPDSPQTATPARPQ